MEALLQAVRQAALEPNAWLDVQREITKYMGGIGSQLASVDHSQDNAFWSRSTQSGVDEMMVKAGSTCEPVLYAAANPHWRVFTDYDYIDEARMEQSSFYELNAECDIRYRMGIRLIDHPSTSRALLVFWTQKQGHADRPQFEKLKQIVEPLRLSAHVALTMGESLTSEKLLIDNLARSRSAALVVDDNANILLANDLVDPILRNNDGLGTLGNSLVFKNRKANSEMTSLVQRACHAARNDLATGGGILAVPRPSELPSYVVIVSPLPKKEQFMGKAKGLVLMVIHDPSQATDIDRRVYMDGFGLTAAEADVAAWFLKGASMEDISKRRGVSLHTVRQQFKDVRKKTNTHRQAELAVLLATMSRL